MLRRNLYLLYKISGSDTKIISKVSSPFSFNNLRTCSTSIKTQKDSFKFNADDVDTFGTLSSKWVENTTVDKGDVEEEKFLENPPSGKKLRTTEYATIIKAYLRKRQIQEAIDVLEKRMMKEDRVKPENYIFNLILGGCGRVGYTKKAFSLFNQMKKRGLQPTGGTYTALFNACANSPWHEDGLSRAKKLKELMVEKGVIANDTTYNAMIKAFGRCGDINTAFLIVDEMLQNKIGIKTEVINFLLQSCISDKEAGYLHALMVWKKFKKYKINPDIYSFNLLLHCIRECQLGNPDIALDLLTKLDTFSLPKNKTENEKKLIEPGQIEIIDKIQNEIEPYSNIPSLIAKNPNLGDMLQLSEINSRDKRLLLVGGCSGFLKTMESYNVQPNIKTFSILLDNIPLTTAAEQALLSQMKKKKIQPDIDFLNMLIKRRCFRKDCAGAKEVLDLFDKFKYRPNIITYGVLALSCETLEDAQMLIKEMKDSGYRINIEILGGLLTLACEKYSFKYVLEIMELVIKENIKLNKQFLEHLANLHKKSKDKLKNEPKVSRTYSLR